MVTVFPTWSTLEVTRLPRHCSAYCGEPCRVIAATNRELGGMVAQGTFRADFFYRLNVIQLHLPPLRERTSDLPLLATHFLEQFCLSHGVAAKALSSESLARLASYDWPGNIRQLGHVLLRACLLTSGRVITPTDLALGGNGPVPPTRLAHGYAAVSTQPTGRGR